MPSRETRARKRQRRILLLPILALLTAATAVVLVVILLTGGMDDSNAIAPAATAADLDALNFVNANETVAPLILNSPTAIAATATARPTTTPKASPQATTLSLVPTPAPFADFLPVYDRANRFSNDEPLIAVTIDDCDKKEAMITIVTEARDYGAKLTLFPTGTALMNTEFAAAFRKCYRSFGYEFENHGYDKTAEYRMTDGELALEIWRQSVATSFVLGGDYQQHFFRPRRAQSNNDQRTHFFIGAQGMLGIGGYTYSATSYDNVDKLLETLKNGNIYQFDMTEKSITMFSNFLDGATRKGYRIATMNELFGLEKNAFSDKLTMLDQEMPTLADYQATYYDLVLNDRTYAVIALQQQLIAQGYLDSASNEADGYYGSQTSIAVSLFQADHGLVATGNADVETQKALFGK